MKALVLAAGLGTRLRPITYSIPKPLVPLCNRPLVAWAIDALVNAGVDEIIVNLHHLPAQLEAYVKAEYEGHIALRFSFEQEILGTGGAIRRVRPHLEEEEHFFVVNADTIQFAPFGRLIEARRAGDALAALTLRHPPPGDRFTSVWLDAGRITGFGSGGGEALMFSGSHLISGRVFDFLPDREFSGIVDEVYVPLLASGTEPLAGVIDDGLWFDIGTPARYLAALRGMLDAIGRGAVAPGAGSLAVAGSVIHSSSTIRGTVSGSSIGAGTTVLGEVRSSAVWDGCFISPDVSLDRCIVTHGVRLEGPLELSGTVICPDDAAIPVEYRSDPGVLLV